jgi:hypothetical protein
MVRGYLCCKAPGMRASSVMANPTVLARLQPPADPSRETGRTDASKPGPERFPLAFHYLIAADLRISKSATEETET